MARRKRSANAGWNWKRLAYIALVITSSSGGFGGYLLKDHPALAGLLQAVLGTVAEGGDLSDADLAGQFKQVIEKTRGFQTAGSFATTITTVDLGAMDVKKAPRVEVSVRSVDAQGDDEEIWAGDLRPATRDEVDGNWSASWADQPFEVDWAPGQRLAVAVTAWTGSRRSTKLYMVAGKGAGFPLRPGAYSLRDGKDPGAPPDPNGPKRRIVFNATRIPDAATPAPAGPIRTARAPSGQRSTTNR